MNGYFQKLSLSIDFGTVNTQVESLRSHGNYTAWQKYGIAYKRQHDFTPATNSSFHLDEHDKANIIMQLPEELLAIEVPDVWLLHAVPKTQGGRVMLPPHVDGVRLCSINVYFETHGEKTAYYDYVSGKNITEVGSFVAEVGDVYLLNSDRPHSVEILNGKPRESISISFINTPYEVIEQALLPYIV